MSSTRKVYVYDKKLGRCVQADRPRKAAAAGPMVNNAYARKPVRSFGLAVHPSQVNDMRQRVAEAGANQGCEVRNDGSVHFTSRSARKRVLRHLGYYDRDGGYGD